MLSQSGAYRVRERILAGPLTLLAGPKTPSVSPQTPQAVPQTPPASPQTPSVGPLTPRAGPQTFTAGPQTPTACPQTPTAGPKIPTAGPRTRLKGQLEAGSEGRLEEEEEAQPVGSDSGDRRMDGRTEFLPILQDFVPRRGRCPPTP